ncbi:MAG TPA: hypothetical protein DGT21_02215 [Armatimonadetes bacterium]|jgi:hypothetical protein|nr:hypothetical protein [Armatimonadota bacterium]
MEVFGYKMSNQREYRFSVKKDAHYLQRAEFHCEGRQVGFIEYTNVWEPSERGHYLDWKNVSGDDRTMEIRCFHRKVDNAGNVYSGWEKSDIKLVSDDYQGGDWLVGAADGGDGPPNYNNLTIQIHEKPDWP